MKREDEFISFFDQNGIGFGNVDIFCIGAGNTNLRIPPLVEVLLAGKDDEGHSPIQQLILIVPNTGTDRAIDVKVMQAQVGELVAAHSNLSDNGNSIHERLKIVVPPDLTSDTILSSVAEASVRSVIIIVDASLIRSEGVAPYTATGATSAPSLSEDIWVPQIHALASRVAATVSDMDTYVILDVGQWSPYRAALLDLLMSIDEVGVMGSTFADDPNALIAEYAEQWNAWLSEGRLGRVLKSIDALPSALDSEKPFLRVQMLHRAGLFGPALEAIEALPVAEDSKPFALVKIAQIAADAGASRLAARYLGYAVNQLDTLEDLELALATVADIADRDVEEKIITQFERLFPDSAALKSRQASRFVAVGNYRAAATTLSNQMGAGEAHEIYLALAESLEGDLAPNYLAIQERFHAQMPTLAASAHHFLIADALRRKLVVHAVDLAESSLGDGDVSRRRAMILLDVIEELSINRDCRGEFLVASKRLQSILTEVVSYLASNPVDGSVRIRLARVLAVDVSGPIGLPLIIAAAVDYMKRPLSLKPRPNGVGFAADEVLAQHSFLENAFSWLEAESPVVLGRSFLPLSLLANLNPNDLASGIFELLQIAGNRLDDDSDIKTLTTWLFLGVSLAPLTSNPNQDLAMVRLVAGRLAVAGRVQQARDLAEQALQSAGTSPQRRRAAWFAMADVYHRLGNNLEGLIAMTCAAAGDVNVDIEQAFHETNALVRLLRDVGLIDFALEVHATAGELLNEMGSFAANQDRHHFLGLQLEMVRLRRAPNQTFAELQDLLGRVLVHAEGVVEREDDMAPAAMMLGQLMRIAEAAGIVVPAHANIILTALLERTPVLIGDLVRVLSKKRPSADDVLQVYKQIEQARYAEDIGYDVRSIALVAQRLLTGAAETDTEHAAFAIELLADRATAIPGWETTARPPPPIGNTGQPAEIAKSISAEGVAVLLAGLNEDGQLVSVVSEAGHLDSARCEGKETFSSEQFKFWTEDFPYRYGIDEVTPNLFYTSTENLRISALPEGRVLVVMDTKLGELPPNMLRIGDEFAGERRAMAAAPSLSWVAAARVSTTNSTGRLAAWISDDERHGHTFSMIAERLRGTFEKHGVDLLTERNIPDGLAGSELVIVTAHGSIAPEGEFFQSVSDEGDVKVTARELAGALRNVGVVVLFVCSGGRADQHPSANTTVGLAKQLLDNGCSCVIASPWPLDAGVACHWLPIFLSESERGALVIDANFEANLSVTRAFGTDPAKSLAMNVFGNPLMKIHNLAH